MTNLMEEVLRSGTAAGVGGHLRIPGSGGGQDRHFARRLVRRLYIRAAVRGVGGFRRQSATWTCEGAHSAAPIWAEFMRRALSYREYRDAKQFRAPDGIVSVEIDPASGMPATPNCPKTQTEVYIAGTEPVGSCPLHGGRTGVTNVAGWDSEAPARAGRLRRQPYRRGRSCPPGRAPDPARYRRGNGKRSAEPEKSAAGEEGVITPPAGCD